MARVVGESGDVMDLSKSLVSTLSDIMETNGKGKNLLANLANSAKDESYKTAEGVVNEVAAILLAALPDCKETAVQLKNYSAFLADLENG